MKTLSNLEKIESYLPVFNGFYSTVFEADEENEIVAPYTYDDYTFDYKGYTREMALACTKQIEKKLKETEGFNFGIKIEFDTISSPREYNFANDSIWVKYTLSEDTAKEIHKYLLKYGKEFTQYIKDRYTSRSGFMSFYSNDASVWIAEYLNDEKQLSHCFGAILEFILTGYSDNDLYEDVQNRNSVYLFGELNEGVELVENTITQFTNDNYQTKNQTEITADLLTYFDENDIYPDFLDFNYVEKRVNKIFATIENKSLNMFARVK